MTALLLSMTSLISNIIPTYNRSNILRNHLYCLLQQDDPNFEVIVIDDGSNDNTEDVINEFLKALPLRYVKTRRNGVGIARNRNLGTSIAKGDLLVFTDDDMLPEVSYLSKFRQEIRKGVCVTGFNFSYRWADPKQTLFFPFGASSGVCRSDFEALGGFDEEIDCYGMEDAMAGYRLFDLGVESLYRPDIVALHFFTEKEAPYRTLEQVHRSYALLEKKYGPDFIFTFPIPQRLSSYWELFP